MTHTRLERTMMFVPACRPELFGKASAGAADAICLDLEDSVPTTEKAASRANVARAFRGIEFGSRLRIFRINGLDTEFAYRDLVDVVEAAGPRIDLVMLPKANSAADVAFVDTMLTQIETAFAIPHKIGIEAQIETAAGFLNAREIAASSPRLEALIFGPGDFAASMRMPAANIGEFDEHDANYPGHRWHAVMQTIVAAARAYGLRAIDGPYAAFNDVTGFERSCRIARAMGFDGKQCIHPAQLEAANDMFAPTAVEVNTAQRIVDASERGADAGRGAVTLDGKMIDAANIRMARVTMERHQQVLERTR